MRTNEVSFWRRESTTLMEEDGKAPPPKCREEEKQHHRKEVRNTTILKVEAGTTTYSFTFLKCFPLYVYFYFFCGAVRGEVSGVGVGSCWWFFRLKAHVCLSRRAPVVLLIHAAALATSATIGCVHPQRLALRQQVTGVLTTAYQPTPG